MMNELLVSIGLHPHMSEATNMKKREREKDGKFEIKKKNFMLLREAFSYARDLRCCTKQNLTLYIFIQWIDSVDMHSV